ERGESRAEIIERHAAPERSESPHQRLRAHEVRHRRVLGQLEDEERGIEAAALDLLDQEVREGLVVERLAGEVDREAERPALEHAGARPERGEHGTDEATAGVQQSRRSSHTRYYVQRRTWV